MRLRTRRASPCSMFSELQSRRCVVPLAIDASSWLRPSMARPISLGAIFFGSSLRVRSPRRLQEFRCRPRAAPTHVDVVFALAQSLTEACDTPPINKRIHAQSFLSLALAPLDHFGCEQVFQGVRYISQSMGFRGASAQMCGPGCSICWQAAGHRRQTRFHLNIVGMAGKKRFIARRLLLQMLNELWRC